MTVLHFCPMPRVQAGTNSSPWISVKAASPAEGSTSSSPFSENTMVRSLVSRNTPTVSPTCPQDPTTAIKVEKLKRKKKVKVLDNLYFYVPGGTTLCTLQIPVDF